MNNNTINRTKLVLKLYSYKKYHFSLKIIDNTN